MSRHWSLWINLQPCCLPGNSLPTCVVISVCGAQHVYVRMRCIVCMLARALSADHLMCACNLLTRSCAHPYAPTRAHTHALAHKRAQTRLPHPFPRSLSLSRTRAHSSLAVSTSLVCPPRGLVPRERNDAHLQVWTSAGCAPRTLPRTVKAGRGRLRPGRQRRTPRQRRQRRPRQR